MQQFLADIAIVLMVSTILLNLYMIAQVVITVVLLVMDLLFQIVLLVQVIIIKIEKEKKIFKIIFTFFLLKIYLNIN